MSQLSQSVFGRLRAAGLLAKPLSPEQQRRLTQTRILEAQTILPRTRTAPSTLRDPLRALFERFGIGRRLKSLGQEAGAGAADVAEERIKSLAPIGGLALFVIIAGAIALGRRL